MSTIPFHESKPIHKSILKIRGEKIVDSLDIREASTIVIHPFKIRCISEEAIIITSAITSLLNDTLSTSTAIESIPTSSLTSNLSTFSIGVPLSTAIITSSLSTSAVSTSSSTSTPTFQSSNNQNYGIPTHQTVLLASFLSIFFFLVLVLGLLWYFSRIKNSAGDNDEEKSNFRLSSMSNYLVGICKKSTAKNQSPSNVNFGEKKIIDSSKKVLHIKKASEDTIRIIPASPSNETIKPPATSFESSRTIRAVLQDSSAIVVKSEEEEDSNSILNIHRPQSPTLATLLRAYQQYSNVENGSLKSIPMSRESRQSLTLRDPILIISNNISDSNLQQSQSKRSSSNSSTSFDTADSSLKNKLMDN